MATPSKISSGVQSLIDRLRHDGVEAGELEAARITEQAKKQAAQIVADAKKEADAYKSSSRLEIERENEAARAAVEMAVRDTVLSMRSQIANRFQAQIRRIVTAQMWDPEFLRHLILAVAGRAAADIGDDQRLEILIAEELLSDKPGADGEQIRKRIDETVIGITAELLRDGVEIRGADDNKPGIRVRLKGEDVEIDLTDEAVAEAVIRHLLPRFRYIVQGIQEKS